MGCGGVERVRPLRDRDIFQSKESAQLGRGFIKGGGNLSELAIDLELEVSRLRNVVEWGQTQ